MKNNYNQGYALIFTLLIISVIVAVASGTALTLTKNLTLSSTARESQIAFYEADTAGECALYASQFIDLDNTQALNCGDLTLDIDNTISPIYFLSDLNAGDKPCFTVEIDKRTSPVVVKARGYNTCGSSKDVVERGIEISY